MSKNSLIIFGMVLVAIFWGRKAMASGAMLDPEWTKFDGLFKKYGRSYSIPWRWLKAIALNESNLGRAKSVVRGFAVPSDIEGSKSSDGKSWGLMQTTIPTSRDFESSVTAIDLNNPETSVRIAAKYIKTLINRFGIADKESIVRAYNGGPGFKKTTLGQTLTPLYYAKFVVNLKRVMELQPGNEMEY